MKYSTYRIYIYNVSNVKVFYMFLKQVNISLDIHVYDYIFMKSSHIARTTNIANSDPAFKHYILHHHTALAVLVTVL